MHTIQGAAVGILASLNAQTALTRPLRLEAGVHKFPCVSLLSQCRNVWLKFRVTARPTFGGHDDT